MDIKDKINSDVIDLYNRDFYGSEIDVVDSDGTEYRGMITEGSVIYWGKEIGSYGIQISIHDNPLVVTDSWRTFKYDWE